MKVTESMLREYLKKLKINEKELVDKLGMSLPTIAAALQFALTKPESGDWKLIYQIKKSYPKFELEEIKATKKSTTEIDSSSIDTNNPSDELELYFRKSIGKKLQALRRSRGYSTTEMGKFLGVEAPNYSAIENGRSHLNCYRLHLASLKLNVSYQTIIGMGNVDDPKALGVTIAEQKEKILSLEKELKIAKSNELKLKSTIADIQSKIKNL